MKTIIFNKCKFDPTRIECDDDGVTIIQGDGDDLHIVYIPRAFLRGVIDALKHIDGGAE